MDTIEAPTKFVLKQQHLDPTAWTPVGDRYTIEEIEVDNSVELNGTRFLLPGQSEKDKGWKAGVIVRVGNGHLLGVPDLAVSMTHKPQGQPDDNPSVEKARALGAQFMTEDAIVVRPPAAVPMFFNVGDVVLVERWAGREITLGTKKYWVVAQEHCLLSLDTPRLVRGENGEWSESAP